jgi:EAL domain-containing protein (putative c-di-GMP-specific phosphodiesterase class I)
LGIEVIAEGVETESQRDILQQIGCQWLQGYFFAKPLSVADFERFIEDGLFASGQESQREIR